MNLFNVRRLGDIRLVRDLYLSKVLSWNKWRK